MNLDWKKVGIGIGIVVVLGILIVAFLLLRGSGSPLQTGTTGVTFGTANENSSVASGSVNLVGSTLPIFSSSTNGASEQPPIFKIADGPVVSGTLLEEGTPTTTIARYITADDGHVLDFSINVPGATPQIVSNTTIPGIERALWTDGGQGVIVQYLDQGVLKSAHIALSAATTTASTTPGAVSIHFLPDNLIDMAVSPNGASLAYLIASPSGADGWVSKTDGSNAQQLFSLPLSQLVLSWPSAQTLFVYSKSASGVPGIAFSVNEKTGAVSPLLYGEGLTATANSTFSYMLYRTDDGSNATLFSENIKTGDGSAFLPPASLTAPLPEQCVWSVASSTDAYCAAPAETLPSDYLDLWHRGEASAADALIEIDLAQGSSTPLATPGTKDGGEVSDMTALSLSPSEQYLSFIAKDDESFWGVQLH